MTLTGTISGLCAALDAGDDGVLPILADFMEEAGDALAGGLRLIRSGAPDRYHDEALWGWWYWPGQVIPPAPTRSAAFFALAAALAEDSRP